jgi:hypothetical protein
MEPLEAAAAVVSAAAVVEAAVVAVVLLEVLEHPEMTADESRIAASALVSRVFLFMLHFLSF